MAVYTPGVAAQFQDPQLRVEHLVNIANDITAQSGIDISFDLVHLEQVDYPDELSAPMALDAITFNGHAAFTNIATLRQAHGADLVVLVRPYANDGYCGYAWLGDDFSAAAQADFGYSVVASNCSDFTLLHELGHNFGLVHSRREVPDGGHVAHAAGHGVDNDFTTIMASPDVFNAVRLPRLSSPLLSCNEQPCGIASSDATNGADAVSAMAASAKAIASYRN